MEKFLDKIENEQNFMKNLGIKYSNDHKKIVTNNEK